MEIITRLLQFFTGAPAAEQIQGGIDTWNAAVENVLSLLAISPVDFQEGAAWAYIDKIYPYMAIVAGSLLAVVMLYRMCKETMDIRQELGLNAIIKMFCTFILAEAIVLNSMSITKLLFRIAGGCITVLGGIGYEPLTASAVLSETSLGLLSGIVALLVGLAFYVMAFLLIYTVYFRFFKIYLIVPLSVIAYALLAGGQELTRSGIAYFKTLVTYTFEIVLILLAINIGNRLGSVGSIVLEDNIVWQMLCPLLTVGLVVGAAMKAEDILRKTFAL